MRLKPSKIRLIASTICQLKCPSCKNALGIISDTLGSKTLSFNDFKCFVDSYPWITQIELGGCGELFLNPDMLAIMNYAHEKKISLTARAGTNLNTIERRTLEGLVKYQFNFLSCSIDGATNEVYQIYRRGGDFHQVISNIIEINKLKAQYATALPRLQWQFILFDHNRHQLLSAKLMALKLGMEFRVKIGWDDFSLVKSQEKGERSVGISAVNRDDYRQHYGKVYSAERVCSQMWVEPQINTDGRVFGCSINHWDDYGNAFNQDLIEIFNSEKMSYARSMLLRKVEERSDIPCVQCPLYREMKATACWLFSKGKTLHA